jgi:tetratricopeptide (TPR) repeat protein
MGWRLGQALTESGAITAGIEVLETTIAQARAIGDQRAAGYAECVVWTARVISDPEIDVDRWESDADRLIGLFEGTEDSQGSALAWMQKSYSLWFRLRLAESGAAAERAIEHARSVGDGYTETEMRGHHMATVGLGPTPLSEALPLPTRLLEDAHSHGDRRLEQSALRELGAMHAFLGRFEEAHRFVREGRAIQQELGLMIEYWAGSQLGAQLAELEGDLDEAARELREGCEHLEELGETAFLSTTAGRLAEIEFRRGDLQQAEHWLGVAERTAAPGDLSSQVSIEFVRGALRAPEADDTATEHLRRAMRLIDETDSPIWRTEVRLWVAEALGPSHRDEAMALAREAGELAGAKGAVVLEDKARRLLEELGVPT